MKFIIFSVALFVVSLSQMTQQTNQKKHSELNVVQNNFYLGAYSIFFDDFRSAACSTCHSSDSDGIESQVDDQNKNYQASQAVHQSDILTVKPALQMFMSTHSVDEAAKKYVDFNKLKEVMKFIDKQ